MTLVNKTYATRNLKKKLLPSNVRLLLNRRNMTTNSTSKVNYSIIQRPLYRLFDFTFTAYTIGKSILIWFVDDTIQGLDSSQKQLEQLLKDKDSNITDNKNQIVELEEVNKKLLNDLEDAKKLNDSMSKDQDEQKKGQKMIVEELNDLIKNKDETISQLGNEIEKNLEDLKSSQMESNKQITSQCNEISSLREQIISKVTAWVWFYMIYYLI